MPTTAAPETIKPRTSRPRGATPATTSARHSADAPPTDQQARAQARRALCTELAMLLQVASQTDEPNERSGNSSRLLRIASDSAAQAAKLAWNNREPEDAIWDVAALMSAAGRVPDDVAGAEREALVAKAWDQILQITGSETRADVDDAHFTAAAAPEKLNAEQLGLVLEVIAGEACTLCDLLVLSELGSSDARRTAFNAARIVAEGIGAKADTASGAEVRGDANMWHYGQSFDTVSSDRGAA